MQISNTGLSLIKTYEGFKSHRLQLPRQRRHHWLRSPRTPRSYLRRSIGGTVCRRDHRGAGNYSASKIERRQQGKALREKFSRNSHAEWKPRSMSQDIVKLIEESDADRIPGLIPVKYQRMSVSPFTFFRGAAIVQARDLANAPVSGITVQACGD